MWVVVQVIIEVYVCMKWLYFVYVFVQFCVLINQVGSYVDVKMVFDNFVGVVSCYLIVLIVDVGCVSVDLFVEYVCDLMYVVVDVFLLLFVVCDYWQIVVDLLYWLMCLCLGVGWVVYVGGKLLYEVGVVYVV